MQRGLVGSEMCIRDSLQGSDQMLIITRKKGESLMIGDDIEVTVSKLEDGSVKLGIQAPKDITILRKELYEQVKKENQMAMKINMDVLKNIKKKQEINIFPRRIDQHGCYFQQQKSRIFKSLQQKY
eukprot:TRINITY_DN23561_c0_g2_i1.p1 TRINITY_DN23561_c0_g2~~TRINITY_DN23561_c0_g2_i1.p1  ORF type:complete len:126 (+),score=12.09 TRINITY_DN23561_c0_g2_i1:123-500(+)